VWIKAAMAAASICGRAAGLRGFREQFCPGCLRLPELPERIGKAPSSPHPKLLCYWPGITTLGIKSNEGGIDLDMFCEYIHAALSQAMYEMIEDEKPFYGEVPPLHGVWAIGKTLEECRENLKGVIEGWIALRLRLGLAIPPIKRSAGKNGFLRSRVTPSWGSQSRKQPHHPKLYSLLLLFP